VEFSTQLGALRPVFHDEMAGHIFEARHVSARTSYRRCEPSALIDMKKNCFEMIVKNRLARIV